MNFSTIIYCVKQGIRNICRNFKSALASIATISACIFLFCMFFSIVVNLKYIVKNVETTVGITVFFDEDLSEADIKLVGDKISKNPEVDKLEYESAKDAWNSFKKEYFGDNEYLAEGFAEDNPLAGSASYTVFLKNTEKQSAFVSYLEALDGVRQVNYSSAAAVGIASLSNMISIISAVIIAVLIAVSVFLISNTINMTATVRRKENEIMRLIGATKAMIRAPFVIEGTILGFIGACIPLVGIYKLYNKVVVYIATQYSVLSGLFKFLPIKEIFPYMTIIALVLGVGMGFFVSFFTIHKHLKV